MYTKLLNTWHYEENEMVFSKALYASVWRET